MRNVGDVGFVGFSSCCNPKDKKWVTCKTRYKNYTKCTNPTFVILSSYIRHPCSESYIINHSQSTCHKTMF